MPEFISLYDEDKPEFRVPVATDEELLEFANRVRVAGGANALEALLPSEPSHPSQCLIANALNFSCSVLPSGGIHPDCDKGLSNKWFMHLPHNVGKERATAIAEATGCALTSRLGHHLDADGNLESAEIFTLELPIHIGNAASAFDLNIRFKEYRLA